MTTAVRRLDSAKSLVDGVTDGRLAEPSRIERTVHHHDEYMADSRQGLEAIG
ncbi:MAG TPA: hypothetical protein VF295_12900 [Candidatus Limnocylindria bacterium]